MIFIVCKIYQDIAKDFARLALLGFHEYTAGINIFFGGGPLFQDSEENITSAEINDVLNMKAELIFMGIKKKKWKKMEKKSKMAN